ncbi:uncharacterized protein PV06_10359 [Exophiala oligosperma]|uniref:FAD dependent oxidoreductase domain-containing protein n=1 Tax=Exophiala oligosperma TaxID=215243 RepID=A0A0D2D344_9EURO|nr:uncharacterized protein PV06_10359 [Exophiala oligosperma]KIW37728.1 hypothetical protein PV06_10359 [Exophiala oligosperma]
MAHSDQNSPMLVLGAGTFGLSTALHLHRAGYTDITIFERAESIPSQYSAAYDLNKIVRAEYENTFYTDLALEAIKEWKTPLFAPYYHETGYIVACSGRAPEKAKKSLSTALSSISKHAVFASGIEPLKGGDAFRKFAWQLDGPMAGYTGYYNRLAGYGHSGNALKGVAEYLTSRGVRFVTGERRGRVAELIYEGYGKSRRCVGVRTVAGTKYQAAKVICALGSFGAALIPDLGKFAVARCWSVAHVQLTEKECDLLRGLPVVNVRDLGFFFEPDPATKLFKLCPLGAGYSNTDADGISLPPSENSSETSFSDWIPKADEVKLRTLLHEMLPWMADRPFVDKKLCWFSDSKDSEYCIDFVPDTNESLVVISGDSGHGFKMMPIMGSWVVELLRKGRQERELWRWRSEDVASPHRKWGTAVSWRVGEAKELEDVAHEDRARLGARL